MFNYSQSVSKKHIVVFDFAVNLTSMLKSHHSKMLKTFSGISKLTLINLSKVRFPYIRFIQGNYVV